MSKDTTTAEVGIADDAALVESSSKKKLYTNILLGVAVVAVIGVAIALIVVFSGNEGQGVPVDPEPPTTPTPTESPETEPPETEPHETEPPETEPPETEPPETEPPETEPPETEPPETEPPEEDGSTDLQLDEFLDGSFSAPTFDASWTSGGAILFRNSNGDLELYDVESSNYSTVVSNSTGLLEQNSRVAELSSEETHIVLAVDVEPTYRYSFEAQYWVIDIETQVPIQIGPSSDNFNDVPSRIGDADLKLQNFQWGPSGTSFAFVYQNDVYYQESLNSTLTQITTSGVEDVIYNGIADWVYEEEVFLSSNALWFSPDGSRLAYVTFDDTNVRIMHVPYYGEPGSLDDQYTEHHELKFPKVGTTNPVVTITIQELSENGSSTEYSAPTDLEDPILKLVRFVTSDTVALMWANRFQTTFIVELCTQGNTNCTEIYAYSEPNGWIDIIPLIFNGAGNSFITILPQTVNGVRYKQIVEISDNTTAWTSQSRTNIAATVLEILLWTTNDVIWYKATHESDSAEQHIYSVDSNGVNTCFTCNITRNDSEPCLFNDAVISPNANYITINCAGPGIPQIYIYNTDGTQLTVWNDNSAVFELAANRTLPATVRTSFSVIDGYPNADVLLQVPEDYLNRTDIPLLVYVYAGPDTSLVTKRWRVDWGSYLVSRYGIAVAQIDGRASGRKGVDNMFAVNQRLGTVEVEDQIEVTRHLQNLSWVDSSRTCIWGWSYGGYAASLALARGGDVFKCAIAVAPVTDWRYYDTIYTERYMGTPETNSEGYTNSSLLTDDMVEAFRDKNYFLVHGIGDDNVHFQHAMLFSRLLQRSNIYFDQMSYTDEAHGLNGVLLHVYEAMEDFLKDNLNL